MTTNTSCVSIAPYFKVHEGKMDEFKTICKRFISQTSEETRCLYYGFSFNGNDVHCREGYEGGEGVLEHLENVGQLLGESLQVADLIRLEIHGLEEELEKLYEPLQEQNPTYFTLQYELER